MKTRGTFALMVLFLGGLMALWWADRSEILNRQDAEALKDRILPALDPLKPADIARIEIRGSGEPAVVLERRGNEAWQLVEPVEALADRGKVDGFLQSLKGLRTSKDAGVVDGPPERFGFESPRVVKLFGPGKGTSALATLDLGDAKSLPGLRYVRPNSGPIVVVDALPLALADLPAVDWRERSLLGLSGLDIGRIQVGGPDRKLAADRKGQSWRIVSPIQAPGDETKFEGLVADLAALRVEDGPKGFVAEGVTDWDKYGLANPDLTLEVGPPPGEAETRRAVARTVQISAPLNGHPDRAHARRGDQDDVILINPTALRTLGKNPNELRSHKLTNLDKTRIHFLAIQVGEDAHELALGPRGWEVVKRSATGVESLGKADGPTVDALLAQLLGLETAEFLDPKNYPEAHLDKPTATVRVWESPSASRADRALVDGPIGEPALNLTLGTRNTIARMVYARSTDDPATLLALPEAIVSALPAGTLAFRDRSLLTQDRFGLDRLTVRRAGDEAGVAYVALQSPATPHPGPEAFAQWRMTQPVDAPADAQAVARVAVLLSGLRAERLVAEGGDPKTYGLDTPHLVVAWTVRNGENALEIGSEVPGGSGTRYARLTGRPLVFTLSRRATEILGAELHDRTLATIPLTTVEKVTFRWPGRRVDLERDPAGTPKLPLWKAASGTDLAGFETARVNTLLDALANLQAARFTQYSGAIPSPTGLSPPACEVFLTQEGSTTPTSIRLGAPGPRLGDETTRHATTALVDDGPVALLAGSLWELWATPPNSPGPLPADPFAPASSP